LDAAGYDLEIGRDFIVESGGIFTTNGNKTIFTGENISDVNGGNIDFYSLEINKVDTAQAVTLGTGTISISGDLAISKGILDVGSADRNISGNIDVVYGNIKGSGALVLNGTSQQTLKGRAWVEADFGNLKLNNSGSAPQVKILSRIKISNVIFNRDQVFDLNIYNMEITDAVYSSSAGWSNSRLFVTNGQASDKGLTLNVSSGDNGTDIQFFPVGVNDNGTFRYTPMQVNANSALSTNGKITVKPVNDYHPTVSDETYALDYYWKVDQNGLDAEESNVSYKFTYYEKIDVPSYGFFLKSDPEGIIFYKNEWYSYGNDVLTSARTLTFPRDSHISQDFSFGVLEGGFVIGTLDPPRTLYSISNGDFNNASIWSETEGGDPVSNPPTSIDYCIVEADNTVTVTNSSNNSTIASQIQIDGTLVVNTDVSDCSVEAIKGSGTIRYSSNNLLNADHSEFCKDADAVFEYSGSSGNYTLPVDIVVYPNLYFTGSSRKTAGNIDLLLNGNLFVDDATFDVSGSADGDLTILGDLIINTGSFRLPNSVARTVDINGNINITGSNGKLKVNKNGSSVEHQINLKGNIIQGDGVIKLSKTAFAKITFTGEKSASFSKTSGTTQFHSIEIDKPVGERVDFNAGFDLLGDAGGTIKPLLLTSGECHLNSSDIDIDLSTGGNDFRIPEGTTLKVDNGATVNVGGSTSNTGIWLDGSLIIDNSGVVNCDQ
jgi:hypothetical protein